MVKNYIKIAWRNLFKNKYYLFITVFGLTISLLFVLFISSYVWQAFQVNSALRNVDQQYLIQSEYKDPSIGFPLTTVGLLPKTLKDDYPHLVADYYRLDGITCIVSNENEVHEESAALGDSTLLNMFGFELLQGDPNTALSEPFSVGITESIAIKYFSNSNALGKTLSIRNFDGQVHDFKVTAVLKSTIENSVMKLTSTMNNQIFLSIANQEYFGRNIDSWENRWIVGFVELQKNVTLDQLNIPLKNIIKQHTTHEVATNLTAILKPLKTYYLDDQNGAIRKLIYALTFSAAFLMLMAVINFINISMSQSIYRLKEVGVRKIMGISKVRLTFELILECVIVVLIASILASILYHIISPLIDSVIGKSIPSLNQLPIILLCYYFFSVILIGILAGSYPALTLAKSNLVQDIKGQFSKHSRRSILKRSLLFFQFTVAIIVLTLSIVIDRQVNLFLNGDLGYNKDHLFTVQVPRDWSEKGLQHIETVQNELKTLPQIEGISLSYDIPGMIGNSIQKIKKIDQEQTIDVQLISSDRYFADTYKIPLLVGKFFNDKNESNTDLTKIVISNKTALALGYTDPADAVGKPINLFDGTFQTTIAGVTADFYPNSMHLESPSIVWFDIKNSNQYRFFSIRIKPDNLHETVAAIEKKWKTLLPDSPFEIKFMDDQINNMYATELQLRNASKMATLISMIIVILSIIGLTSLAVNQRIKEIGIRRVLGASIFEMINIFIKDFIGIFVLSIITACPIAYYLISQWLANYANKIPLSTPLFLIPIFCLVLLIFSFLGIIITRASLINPIKNLRDE